MPWEKPGGEAAEFLAKTIGTISGVVPRRMFGCPCYFTPEGNMFCGVHEKRIFIRLDPALQRETMQQIPEAEKFQPMKGRVMHEYLVFDQSLIKQYGEEFFCKILHTSFRWTSSLPARKK